MHHLKLAFSALHMLSTRQRLGALLELTFKINYRLFWTDSESSQRPHVFTDEQAAKAWNASEPILLKSAIQDVYSDPRNSLSFYLVWRAWSECPVCNQVGLVRRLGECYMVFNHTEYQDDAIQRAQLNRAFSPLGVPCNLNLHTAFKPPPSSLQDRQKKAGNNQEWQGRDLIEHGTCNINCKEFQEKAKIRERVRKLYMQKCNIINKS